MNIKELNEIGDGLFTKRSSLILLWQEIAEQFFPERADFTFRRTLGTDFASNLVSSYPIITRRELGDQMGQMLRPTAKEWFKMKLSDPERETNPSMKWLEEKTKRMKRAMYHTKAHYVDAVKQGDHDFASFGQTVRGVRVNKQGDGLIYRTYHLRDVAWMDNEEDNIACVFRKWNPTARELKRIFGNKVHKDVDQLLAGNKPFEEVDCKHIIVEADMYDGDAQGKPYWSIYYDCAHQHLMEAVPVWNREYNVARWQKVSGSQYAFSPAAIAALPDARLLQSMTYTLLEAGEKAVNPPMVATQDVVRSDVSIFAGGITWVDRDYDEKLGEALRVLTQDKSGLPFGAEMQNDCRAMLMQAFFINKLNLPARGPEMTAYEIGQRIQEYIRGALPIFEPMEMECNGGDCELTFDILLREGVFGSVHDMPKELQGADVTFSFDSPLHDAIEEQKGQKFLNMAGYIAAAVQLDPTAAYVVNAKITIRDVLAGTVPTAWVNDEDTVDALVAKAQEQQSSQEQLAVMQQGADVVGTLAKANADQGLAA